MLTTFSSVYKPFQLNLLKQNTENVRNDHFKIKTQQIIKNIEMPQNTTNNQNSRTQTKQSIQTKQFLITTKSIVERVLVDNMGQFIYHRDIDSKKITRKVEK